MAEIQLKGISKSFDDNKVINSLDLSIANGEFITVLGPSGCGKSGVLRGGKTSKCGRDGRVGHKRREYG